MFWLGLGLGAIMTFFMIFVFSALKISSK